MEVAIEATDRRTSAAKEKKKRYQFQKGNTHGAAGRPAAGMQSFKDRLAIWCDTKTVAEIENLVKNKKAWGNMIAGDAMVVMRLSEALERGGGASMTIILDRLLGKAPQAITGEDGKPLLPATDVNEIARRTAFLLSLPNAAAPVVIDQPRTITKA